MIKITKFYTNMCGPCRTYAPVFEKVSQKFPQIEFQSLDAHSNRELVEKYGIKGVPATIIEKEGVYVRRLMGAQTEQQLTQIIKSL